MENTFADALKDGQRTEDSVQSSSKVGELNGDNGLGCSDSKMCKLVKKVSWQKAAVLKVLKVSRGKSCVKDPFLQRICVMDRWIPKHMVTVDEKYFRRCLELIHITASTGNAGNISWNMGWENIGVFSEGSNPAEMSNWNTDYFESVRFDHPVEANTGSMVISHSGQWIVGSIMGSKSMMNIIKSPMLNQYGTNSSDVNFEVMNFADVKGPICYHITNSPSEVGTYSSQKLNKGIPSLRNSNYGFERSRERLFSRSSTNSSCSDQSSSSFMPTVSQGMLQCTWKGGKPHFVFSLDDQKIVYMANLLTVESADKKNMEHTYVFYSRIGGKKEYDFRDKESHLVGKMTIATSFTHCPSSNCTVMEREFVLFGGIENFVGDMPTSGHEHKKSKGLSKKVLEVLRTNHPIKKRTISLFSDSSAILENHSFEQFQDTETNAEAVAEINLLDRHLPSNLELTAIVMKDHIPDNRPEKIGGWGLKFLKKVSLREKAESLQSSMWSTSCDRGSGDCSTSINVLVPAGVHGGPRSRLGGPATLIQRWKSDGCCDCGGWDLGCPLTILQFKFNQSKPSSREDTPGECKLIDLCIQGSENSAPPLRMVNVHNGLYFVNFQSTMSALQSFSIAVAFIHAQSPALRPENMPDLNKWQGSRPRLM